MPAVFVPPFDPTTPNTGQVIRVHRRPGYYAGAGDPVLDIQVGEHVLSLVSPFDGKIMLCREVGFVAKAGDRVFETTAVGKPTWEVFIAYRRSDVPGHVGRLGDQLIKRFGPGQVFKDIESLALGESFDSVISDRINRASALLVVIGPAWQSNPRLQDVHDVHRAEIRTAIQRNIDIVPVLVNEAGMPKEQDLPEDIRPLARRQGIQLPEVYWEAGVERIVRHLESVLDRSPRRIAFLKQVPSWEHRGFMWVEDDPDPNS